MIKQTLADTEEKMAKSLEIFERDLSGMRAGRAHPALLDRVLVEYYGVSTPLQQLAAISVPEPRMLVVQPYDKGATGAIEKAVQKADLGVSVRIEGTLLRVSVPPLTEERRKDLVRQLRRRVEEEKVTVRNVRREAVDAIKTALKNRELPEDEARRAETDIQKMTDRFVKMIDEIGESREKDVMTP